MKPTVEPLDGRAGVELWDPIENARFELHTDAEVDVETADVDDFAAPLDAAATIGVTRVTLDREVPLAVRQGRDAGTQVEPASETTVAAGENEVEVMSLPFKLYLRFTGPMTIEREAGRTALDFGEPTRLTLGLRSVHRHPAATVTTTDDPRALMEAVSTFGSALKTTSPERSFPTLRGHPPLLELGDELSIPDALDLPETGVRIEVPERLDAIYQVTPLAFYLGAAVVPGAEPRLVAGDAVEPLGPVPNLHEAASALLRHCFTLDCIVRTEGLYELDLHERERLEARVDVDAARLYDAPLDERTAAYLDVDREAVADVAPRWHLTTDVTPEPTHAVTLPFVADDLSQVRCPEGAGDTPAPPEPPGELTDFFRGSAEAASPGELVEGEVFVPEPVDTPGLAHVGSGYPLGGSKPTPESYRGRVDREVREEPGIDVLLVVNDVRMSDEAAADLYGVREMLDFSVDVRHDVPVDDLRELLEQQFDFFHYVGHVDDEGLRCSDGWLDCRTLTGTGVRSFLLNACASYEQGRALVDGGALGGVATVTDIHNSVATEAGKTLAELLNAGFSLHTALHITKEQLVTSYRYTIVGDGELTLCQNELGVPGMAEIERTADGYRYWVSFFPVRSYGMGSINWPVLPGEDQQPHLAGGRLGPFDATETDLRELAESGSYPVRFENELCWSDELPFDA